MQDSTKTSHLHDLVLALVECRGNPRSSSAAAAANLETSQNNNSNSSREAQNFWRRFESPEMVFCVLRVIEILLSRRDDGDDATTTTTMITTQRDVYYTMVEQLPRDRDQTLVNRAIESVTRFLNSPRHELGIVASTRGFAAGSLAIGAASLEAQPFAIPGEFAALPDTAAPSIPIGNASSSPRCILVVEKDSVFQALVAAQIWQRYPLVVITGRGFADIATRVLVSRLARWLQVPVYGLADCNPAGARILHVYRFGAAASSSSSSNAASSSSATAATSSSVPQCTCPSLRWLGARVADAAVVAPSAKAQFTPRDHALAKGLIRELDSNNSNNKDDQQQQKQSARAWKEELEAMQQLGVRFDLEAVPDLVVYVMRKVLGGDAI